MSDEFPAFLREPAADVYEVTISMPIEDAHKIATLRMLAGFSGIPPMFDRSLIGGRETMARLVASGYVTETDCDGGLRYDITERGRALVTGKEPMRTHFIKAR